MRPDLGSETGVAGDEVEATVIELDNEFGEMELSLKGAGRKRSWEKLKELFTKGEVINVKIIDANKGGLITRVENVPAFIPVSQLSPNHYPRVAGGEKKPSVGVVVEPVTIPKRERCKLILDHRWSDPGIGSSHHRHFQPCDA